MQSVRDQFWQAVDQSLRYQFRPDDIERVLRFCAFCRQVRTRKLVCLHRAHDEAITENVGILWQGSELPIAFVNVGAALGRSSATTALLSAKRGVY